jgi:hypothetical protein
MSTIKNDQLRRVTGGASQGPLAAAVGNSISINNDGDRFRGYNQCRAQEGAQANQEVGKVRHWLADHVFGLGQGAINNEIRAKQAAHCDWMKGKTR